MLNKTTVQSAGAGDAPLIDAESPSLLGRALRKVRRLSPLFLATVVAPTSIAVLYYGVFASDVYISESRFVVRASERGVAAGGVGALLRSAGWGNAGTEVYAARDFVMSRDALNELNRDGAVEKAYTAPEISIFDRFNPFGLSGSNEDLFNYYSRKVSIVYDSTSAITTLQVRAYSPQSAREFNAFLLGKAEALVNSLNARAQADLIRLARSEVEVAQAKVTETALALAQFRDRSGVVDPQQQFAVQLQMVSKLQDELISTRMRLVQLRQLAPNNPQIPVLEDGILSLQREIGEETAKIAGGTRSLAGSTAEYQRVLLDNEFAEKQLASAMAAYEEARSEALRKQAYVERIVESSLPDHPSEPRRIRGIITALVLGLVAWGVISMLIAGVREHRD